MPKCEQTFLGRGIEIIIISNGWGASEGRSLQTWGKNIGFKLNRSLLSRGLFNANNTCFRIDGTRLSVYSQTFLFSSTKEQGSPSTDLLCSYTVLQVRWLFSHEQKNIWNRQDFLVGNAFSSMFLCWQNIMLPQIMNKYSEFSNIIAVITIFKPPF